MAGEQKLQCLFSFLEGHESRNSSLMTSNTTNLPEAPPPTTIHLGSGLQHVNSGRAHSVHNKYGNYCKRTRSWHESLLYFSLNQNHFLFPLPKPEMKRTLFKKWISLFPYLRLLHGILPLEVAAWHWEGSWGHVWAEMGRGLWWISNSCPGCHVGE